MRFPHHIEEQLHFKLIPSIRQSFQYQKSCVYRFVHLLLYLRHLLASLAQDGDPVVAMPGTTYEVLERSLQPSAGGNPAKTDLTASAFTLVAIHDGIFSGCEPACVAEIGNGRT